MPAVIAVYEELKKLHEMGFENTDYDEPLEFTGSPTDISVNGVRLSIVDTIYLGEEAVTFSSAGKEIATVFHSDVKGFHQGGKARCRLK
jgi:hypothetical protein